MALIQSSGAPQSGGGGGGSYDWAMQTFEVSVAVNPPTTYANFPLTFPPVNVNGILIWSEGQPLFPDQYQLIGQSIRLLFPIDPTLSADGISWKIAIQYPYTP